MITLVVLIFTGDFMYREAFCTPQKKHVDNGGFSGDSMQILYINGSSLVVVAEGMIMAY